MGCDIHLHVEIKLNGKWEHYNHPRVDRWYELFALMANVRNDGDITPIAEPRGLPPDATVTTLFDANEWGSDGHSHSWLSSGEVQAVMNCLKGKTDYETFGYLFGDNFGAFVDYPDERPTGLEDFRFVFWFDN